LRVMAEKSPAAEAIKNVGADPAAIARAAEERLPGYSAERVDTPPALTPTLVRAIAAVAGTPPKKGMTMFPIPWAINS